jgi:hypothetical protein
VVPAQTVVSGIRVARPTTRGELRRNSADVPGALFTGAGLMKTVPHSSPDTPRALLRCDTLKGLRLLYVAKSPGTSRSSIHCDARFQIELSLTNGLRHPRSFIHCDEPEYEMGESVREVSRTPGALSTPTT